MVLLELRCSLLHMTMARRQTGNPQRTGRKTTSTSGGQKTVSGLSPQVLPQGKKKSKGKYAKEIPEPRRNSNIIPSSNLLFNETLLQEKTKQNKKNYKVFILKRKTTQPQTRTLGVKNKWNEKHSLVAIPHFKCLLDKQMIKYYLYLWWFWSLVLSLKQGIKKLLTNKQKSSKNPW